MEILSDVTVSLDIRRTSVDANATRDYKAAGVSVKIRAVPPRSDPFGRK